MENIYVGEVVGLVCYYPHIVSLLFAALQLITGINKVP